VFMESALEIIESMAVPKKLTISWDINLFLYSWLVMIETNLMELSPS
jgi:hypothetical protein